MATKVKREHGALYDADFHAWAEAQMTALRRHAGRLPAEIDAEHLIEELDMARRRDRAAASGQVTRAVEHLLKLDHSPAAAPRNSWLRSVRSARAALRPLLRHRGVGSRVPRSVIGAMKLSKVAAMLADGGEPAKAISASLAMPPRWTSMCSSSVRTSPTGPGRCGRRRGRTAGHLHAFGRIGLR